MVNIRTEAMYDPSHGCDRVVVNAASETLAKTALFTVTYGAGARKGSYARKKAGTGVAEPSALQLPAELPASDDAPAMAAISPGCMFFLKGNIRGEDSSVKEEWGKTWVV